MLQSYDDLINDSRNTHVTVQGTRGGKPRYYLHIVKRCLQLQAVNLWVSGGEDGSKYSLDATPPYSSSLSFFLRRFPTSFALHHALFVSTNRSSASRNSNLPSSCFLSSSIVEHGSKRKHPIDCVPSTLTYHFSLNELQKIYFLKIIFKRLKIYLFNYIRDIHKTAM